MPEVLIIIVTWNKKQDVLNLLKSVKNMDYPPSSADVLVIDNASQDGTWEAISAAYPYARVIRNTENLGGSDGFNTGLQWAFDQPPGRYRYLWLLDNDVTVHPLALAELVELLKKNQNIAVAGSTMMQLDCPWRINEMGAFLNRSSGRLILNRHLETVAAWEGRSLASLLSENANLCNHLRECRPYAEADYVAAASLLVRAEVAKTAGLWRNYFIHFDDVEWCLRIAQAGHRIVASAKSLIWHSSASAKTPHQTVYYDNRNILDLLRTYRADEVTIRRVIRRVWMKAIYFALTGRGHLSRLHREAATDFMAGRLGKKDIHPNQNAGISRRTMPQLTEVFKILKTWMRYGCEK